LGLIVYFAGGQVETNPVSFVLTESPVVGTVDAPAEEDKAAVVEPVTVFSQ